MEMNMVLKPAQKSTFDGINDKFGSILAIHNPFAKIARITIMPAHEMG